MSISLPLAAALSGLLAAPHAKIDVAAGAASDVSLGLLPVAPGQPSELGFGASLRLGTGVLARGDRGQWSLVYTPEVYVQWPNQEDALRPLVLHGLGWSLTHSATRRTLWNASLNASLGDLSYANFYGTLPPGTTPPPGAFTPVFSGEGSIGWSWQRTRRHGMSIGAQGGYTTFDLFSGSTESRVALETTANAGVNWANRLTLTPRDSLNLTLGANGFYIEEQADDERDRIAGNVSAGWQRELSARSSLAATVGVLGAWSRQTQDVRAFPTATGAWSSRFQQWDAAWTANLSAGVAAFFDQTRGDLRPQANLQGGLRTVWTRHWSSGLTLGGSTSVAPEPIDPPGYVTTATVAVPVTYTIDDQAQLTFGARGSARGPHLAEPTALVWQPEAVGFIGFRYTVGTDQTRGSWLPL